MGPFASVLSHPSQASMTIRASPVTLHFYENFMLKIFPFLTSLSQPLLIFTSLLIPSELAPWHHSPCSKTEPGLRRSSAFEEQRVIEALNQAWIFIGESTSLSPCPYLSLPFPGAILSLRCSISLSFPLHFSCPWSSLGFCWMWKGGFWFKVLMFEEACETFWLNSSHMDF